MSPSRRAPLRRRDAHPAGGGPGALRRRVTSARRIARERGGTGLVHRAAQIALRPPWGRFEWFHVMETAADSGRACVRPVWVTDPADPAVDELAAFGQPVELLRRRLSAGGRAATARVGGRVAAYAWVHGTGEYDEGGILIRVRAHEAWVYDGLTHPEHRGRRLYARLVLGMAEDLAAEGRTRLLSTIDVPNRPSLRSAAARGARRRGSLLMVRLLRWSVLRVAWRGAPPRWRVFRGTTRLEVP